MKDEDLLIEALPWVKELVRRKLLAVQVLLPATAISAAKIAYAWPDENHILPAETQMILVVEDWYSEEPADVVPCMAANAPAKPRPVS
jgi:hypothetical protein